MADRDAHLTDPRLRGRPGRPAARSGARRRRSRPDRPDARRCRRPRRTRRGGGTIYLATVDGDGNAVSLIESNYMGFGSGVVDPETGIHYQNRGSYFSLDPDHPNVLAPGKRTLHTLLPGMLFRTGRPAVGRRRLDGRRRPAADPRPGRVGARRRRASTSATAVAAPRWFVEPAEHFAPPVDVRLEPRFAPGIARGAARPGPSADRAGAVRQHARPLPRHRARGRRTRAAGRVGGCGHRSSERGPARRLVSSHRSCAASLSRLAARTDPATGPPMRT